MPDLNSTHILSIGMQIVVKAVTEKILSKSAALAAVRKTKEWQLKNSQNVFFREFQQYTIYFCQSTPY